MKRATPIRDSLALSDKPKTAARGYEVLIHPYAREKGIKSASSPSVSAPPRPQALLGARPVGRADNGQADLPGEKMVLPEVCSSVLSTRVWHMGVGEDAFICVCCIMTTCTHHLRSRSPHTQALSQLGYLRSTVPLVVFGHSFGAMMGLHVARTLKKQFDYVPRLLVFAGCRPLHVSSSQRSPY
jgi:hypothetical protein